MKIVKAEVFVTCPGRNFVTLKITTEDGITGLGDATLNGRELSVASYLQDHLCPQLIGRDAHRIEDIWQFFYKGAYWRRGPVTMSAISAVDMALWDIKAKAANMPLYQLLGGASREGVMVYCHTTGHSIDEALDDYARHQELGFKAIRVQCGIPGMKTTYGMSKGKGLAYEPATKGQWPEEQLWSTEKYLDFMPKLFDAVRNKFSTMVDRIVPAVTEDTLAKIEQLTGVGDPAGVACEPFRQWVIEDNFVAGRPEWEKAGAELVSDVLPYEEMKLRMLNGSHSFLAYLGYLAGYQHINDCMEDEHYRYAAYGLMLQEQAPTLKVQGVDLQDYANRLIARYSNPALRHRTWQIAMDGSQKLPQRMLDSVRWHLAHDSKFDLLALGVAGWMRYVGGVDEQGNPIEISDPLLPVIQKAVQSSAEGKARVQSLLAIKAIFGDDLPDNSLFTAKVTEAYLSLLAHGAKATVAKYSVK
ncbi:hypothetical protein [Escherichia coli]|uniref:mannitol dehydrogenase family protein n=1 Tax=Escherichia coli TaxID=562 RepID=UPI0022281AA9|nr:hypothetical protein [Escherichia coli]EJN0435496.1 hypothetical protein [Escherichia coli]MCD3670959.1 hypothetical protein [Escherichia coli]MCD3811391.1 hypothetical protein [Escherichia coli]MCW3382206.1 hypothetical protein [Escherichia coli]MED9449381.1 hypothetical protein [Escherichia coli]